MKSSDSATTGRWSTLEKQLFLQAFLTYGRRWSKYSTILPSRSHKQVRSHAQKCLKKGLARLEAEIDSESECKCVAKVATKDACVQCDELDVALDCVSPSVIEWDQRSTGSEEISDESMLFECEQTYI